MYDNSRMNREISRYLKTMTEEEDLSRRYVGANRCLLKKFRLLCQAKGINTVNQVDLETARSFLKDGYSKGSSSWQVQTATIIRRFLRHYDNPVAGKLKIKANGTSRTRIDWLTPEECQRIFDTDMQPDQSVLIGAGLLQGLRRKETIRITVGEVRQALASKILSVKGKTGPRSIPLHRDFQAILERYLAGKVLSDEQLLLNMKETKSDDRLAEFSQRFGKKFTFHTLRRSFGRNLWLLGIPIETIGELYGHASVDMTRQYLGVGITDMGKALAIYSFGIARPLTKDSLPGIS